MRYSNQHIGTLAHCLRSGGFEIRRIQVGGVRPLLLFLLLFLASCSKEGDTDPDVKRGSGRMVRREVQYLVRPMEEASGGDATRAATVVPLSEDEAKIHNLRVLQFGGTADGSLLLKNEVVDVSKINTTTGAFEFDFEELEGGGDITVYLIANVDDYNLPTLTVNATKLSEFRESCIEGYERSEEVMKSDGLPMLASGAFDPATAAPPAFKLKGLYAKVVFSFDTAPDFKPGPFCLYIENTAGGKVTVTESTPGDAAVRPAGIYYANECLVNDDGSYDGTPVIWYIAENLSGRNAAIKKDEDRWGTNVPEDASYCELYDTYHLSNLSYAFYLGDGTPQDFNLVRHHQYTMHVTLKGVNTTDKRITLQTANCYMVLNNYRTYTFLATVMGNGAVTPAAGANAPEIVPAPLHPVDAKVLWEQSDPTGASNVVGDVIQAGSVSVLNGTYIQFTTGTKPGNAVIGAFDKNGKLIWSWHIWRPESYVRENDCHTPYPTAGGGRTFKMMDRNLGAFNNNVNDVKAYGLMYQWGRKDPFPNATEVEYDDADAATFKGVIEENGYSFAAVENPTGITVQSSVQTPMTFYYDEESTHDEDWLQVQNDNLWGNPYKQNVSAPNPDLGSKSIYDPCPPGYRVPPQDTWSQATTSNSMWESKGYDLGVGTGGTKYFYPAAGVRWGDVDMGRLVNVGTYGYYWSSSSSYGDMYAGSLRFGNGDVNPLSYYSRSTGLSVRCAKE